MWNDAYSPLFNYETVIGTESSQAICLPSTGGNPLYGRSVAFCGNRPVYNVYVGDKVSIPDLGPNSKEKC